MPPVGVPPVRADVTRCAPPTLVINFIYTLRNAQGRTCSPEPPDSARLIRSVIIIILHASDTRREIFQFNYSHQLRQMQSERESVCASVSGYRSVCD